MGLPKLSSIVSGQYVTKRLFISQLEQLKGQGFNIVSLEDIADICINQRIPSSNEVCITFDDGYMSVYEEAVPVLKEHNLTATIFVVVETIGGINDWDVLKGDVRERMMDKEQIKELSDNGFEIASHTLTHPYLAQLPEDRIIAEIKDSKARLEDIIGKEVKSISYPYGNYNDFVVNASKEAGYKYAATTKLDAVYSDTNPFEIPRINVRWNTFPGFLMKKINKASSVQRTKHDAL